MVETGALMPMKVAERACSHPLAGTGVRGPSRVDPYGFVRGRGAPLPRPKAPHEAGVAAPCTEEARPMLVLDER